jgi:hypothetical protein
VRGNSQNMKLRQDAWCVVASRLLCVLLCVSGCSLVLFCCYGRYLLSPYYELVPGFLLSENAGMEVGGLQN